MAVSTEEYWAFRLQQWKWEQMLGSRARFWGKITQNMLACLRGTLHEDPDALETLFLYEEHCAGKGFGGPMFERDYDVCVGQLVFGKVDLITAHRVVLRAVQRPDQHELFQDAVLRELWGSEWGSVEIQRHRRRHGT